MTDYLLTHDSKKTLREKIDLTTEKIREKNNMNNETITYQELKDGIKNLFTNGSVIDAEIIFKAALESREHWEDGDIVKSASGNIFKRLSDGNWQNMAGRGTYAVADAEIVTDKNITRPLTLIGKAVLWDTASTVN